MPFTAMTKPSVGEATKKSSFADLTIDNLVYLNSMIGATAAGGSLIANGSFEADVDTDGIPDGWAIEEYTAGAFARDITTPGHGAVAIKFTSPGATGGGEISSALFPVSPRVPIIIDFLTKSSVAGIHNQLLVSWYTTSNLADYIETTTLWDKDTSNPSAWKRYQFVACAPATGLWACVTLVGAKNDNATAGVAYFDGVTVTAGLPAIGWVEAAIAEDSTNSNGWEDNGSVSIPLPPLSAGSIVRISVLAQVKIEDFDNTASQRFRVGTDYSQTKSTIYSDSTSYVQHQVQFFVRGASGAVTLYQQLMSSGSSAAYGKVDANSITYEILAS